MFFPYLLQIAETKKNLESLRTLGGSETSLASRNKYYNIITILKKI